MSKRARFLDQCITQVYQGEILARPNSKMLTISDGTSNRLDLSESGFVAMVEAACSLLSDNACKKIALKYLQFLDEE